MGVGMTPVQRKAVIDALVAGERHYSIVARLGISRSTIGDIARRAGLQRKRPPRHDGKMVLRPGFDKTDGTPSTQPKALQPWPAWATFHGQNFTKADIALLRKA